MIRRYLPAVDAPEIDSWTKARGHTPQPPSTRPETGFIMPGIAVCFIWLTNSSLAYVGDLETNPKAPVTARYRACAELMERCLMEAKSSGHPHVIAITASKGGQRWLKRHGFSEGRDPCRLYCRSI